MKYPFTPELLDALPEELAELFRGLEDTLLERICERLDLADELNEVTVESIRALRSHGIELDEIEKAIRDTTGTSKKKLDALMDDVVERNKEYYGALADKAQITAPEHIVDADDIAAIRRQTWSAMKNITGSMGFLVVDGGRLQMKTPAKAYQWALDQAVLQVQSGAVGYNEAIAGAVKQLAGSGLKTVDYESGRREYVDVAVRRAVMTGVNQTCDKYTEQSMDFLKTRYCEISAHSGARDKDGPKGWENHKRWQGKVYYDSEHGEPDPLGKYPDLHASTGFGEVDGLTGANCRHRRFAFVEGVSERAYTDEQLEHIDDGLGCEFEGKHYTAYGATQQQRKIERTVRKLEREQTAYKAAHLTDEAQAVSVRIQRLRQKYRAFSKAAGLPEQWERMQVAYADDSMTAEAKALKAAQDRAAEQIREDIKGGKYPLTVNPEKQARHMEDTAEPGRSVVTISMEELQEIVHAKAGSGRLQFVLGTDKWKKQEIIDVGKIIGFTVNKSNAKIVTDILKLHYSKSGLHAVPKSRRKHDENS